MLEEAVNVLTRDPTSLAARTTSTVHPEVKFAESSFLRFLYNYLLNIRSNMWCTSDAESDNMHAVSQTLSAVLRELSVSQEKGRWAGILKREVS